MSISTVLATALLLLAGCSEPPQQVDRAASGPFALYRSGRLDAQRLATLCDLGVEEMVVMDGSAVERECALRDRVCPGLRIRYNTRQDARRPLDEAFLGSFAAWVEQSRQAGRKIAIRCRHGWHRTGRLTAFYRIRFQGWTSRRAIEEMNAVGRMMWRFPELQSQVEALEEWLLTGDCSAHPESCPEPVTAPANADFASDLCPPPRSPA